jgi:hypothetical protein
MAYTTINKPSEYFNTKLYTGTGSTQSITGVGFQPDFLWIKSRGLARSNQINDVVRGAGKIIATDNASAEFTDTDRITTLDSDGFTLGSNDNVNGSSDNLVSWNWLANGAGVSNTDGSITSTVSANTTSGFSIVKYAGDGNQSSTVGHGLGTAPAFMFTRHLNDVVGWNTRAYHSSLSANQSLYLNDTAQASTIDAYGGIASVGANTFGFASISSNPSSNAVNSSNSINYIAYCFAEKKGFSKFGSYTGNGNADGTFIYTGFKPAFIMIKRTDTSGDWLMKDNKRPTVQNPVTSLLYPNKSDTEATGVNDADFLSNGYKIRTTGTAENASGGTYIYMAFAENPLVGTNGVPATAR